MLFLFAFFNLPPCQHNPSTHTQTLPRQAFRGRLVEVIDQAQHFAALGPVGGGGSTGDSAQAFREGLDGTERESEYCPVW
jgi:hypothetical protein